MTGCRLLPCCICFTGVYVCVCVRLSFAAWTPHVQLHFLIPFALRIFATSVFASTAVKHFFFFLLFLHEGHSFGQGGHSSVVETFCFRLFSSSALPSRPVTMAERLSPSAEQLSSRQLRTELRLLGSSLAAFLFLLYCPEDILLPCFVAGGFC